MSHLYISSYRMARLGLAPTLIVPTVCLVLACLPYLHIYWTDSWHALDRHALHL